MILMSHDYIGEVPFAVIALFIGRQPISQRLNVHVAFLGLHLFWEAKGAKA